MAIQKGTGFTNLRKVLQANRGNRLGQTVTGGVQGEVQGINTQVKTAQQQFDEEAQKNRLDTKESADKRAEILGRFAPSSGSAATQQAPAGTAPTTVPGTQPATPTTPQPYKPPVSDKEITDFTRFRTGTYAGPKELKDAMSLFGKAQQIEQFGSLARSEGGRQELLRRFVGGKDYTTGQRQLDSTLLGQNPGQLGIAARQARGVTQTVGEANRQASNVAQEYVNRAKDFGKETLQKIEETKKPLSTNLDTRVQEAIAKEDSRLKQLKEIQDILVGDNADYKNLDKWTRAGLALQEASNKGILSPEDITMLLGTGGKTGLLQRGINLGLDMNKLINERFTNKIAENMVRTGVANEEDVGNLNTLDRLAGKMGTDLEFLDSRGLYSEGKTGFNIQSLIDYISKLESERAATDSDFAKKFDINKLSYLDQALLYGKNALGAGIGAIGNLTGTEAGLAGLAGTGLGLSAATGFGAPTLGAASGLGLGASLGMDVLTGKDTTAQTANMVGQTGLNLIGTGAQGKNAVLEGLLNLQLGGNSLAKTEAGRQLLKAIELNSKLENEVIGAANKELGTVTGGIGGLTSTGLKDLTRGNISNLAKNVAASTGVTSAANLAKNVSSAVKKVASGRGIKISDEELKTDIKYSPKDVQKFMDRIKPAAYNYKDEIKNSPFASKNRELGVMAQDLEKSKLGKDAVHNTKQGKIVDYDNLEPKMLASIAALNKRLKELENK